ncbi:MAG: hypothetical protein RRB22_01150 [Gammaproteobacteria bacterium]|nr:hypothetical protein [Gammaproteobacteria bacterium]
MPLVADRNTYMKDGEIIPVPVAAGAVCFAGGLAVANATGFAAPGSVATTLTYLGRFEEKKDNTGGADGAVDVLVRRNKAFQFANSAGDAVTQASLGKVCYIEDDETVSATNGTGTRSAAGIVIGIDADGVWIE